MHCACDRLLFSTATHRNNRFIPKRLCWLGTARSTAVPPGVSIRAHPRRINARIRVIRAALLQSARPESCKSLPGKPPYIPRRADVSGRRGIRGTRIRRGITRKGRPGSAESGAEWSWIWALQLNLLQLCLSAAALFGYIRVLAPCRHQISPL